MENLKKIWNFLPKKLQLKFYAAIGVALILSIFEMLSIATIFPFLSLLSDQSIIHHNYYINVIYSSAGRIGISSETEFILIIGVFLVLIILLSTLLKILSQYMTNNFIEATRASISSEVLNRYLNQNYEFFLSNNSSDLVKTCILEIDQFSQNLLRPLFTSLIYWFVFILIFALLLVIEPKLSLITAFLFGLLYIIFFQVIKKKIKKIGDTVVLSNRNRLFSINDTLGDVKLVKLKGNEEQLYKDYFNHANQLSQSSALHMTLSQVPNAVVELFAFGGLILTIVIALAFSSNSDEGILVDYLPTLGLYTFAAYKLIPALRNIFAGAVSLKYSERLTENIVKAINLASPKVKVSDNIHQRNRFHDKIVFDAVNYTYPNSNTIALKDIDFEIEKGSATAFVGKTGSGKSTIINIMLGLILPEKGNVKIDGILLQDSILTNWKKLVGYVPQDPHFMDATIITNITRGASKNEIELDKIQKIVKIACVDELILSLDHGYDTVIGESAKRLSGGQKQRLAIARALYHEPEVLILDEATSAIDNVTERKLLENLINETSNEMTLILITHRLQNLSNFSQIIMCENGEIIETGSYSKMLKSGQRFNALMRGRI